jgi:hypothetical protein
MGGGGVNPPSHEKPSVAGVSTHTHTTPHKHSHIEIYITSDLWFIVQLCRYFFIVSEKTVSLFSG